MKTQTESTQPTSLESRFTRSVYDAYVRSPKQPPLVFQARAPGSGPLEGVDVVRCRRNGLANAPFPLPIFCPADNIEPARPGHLADLSFVDLQNRGRDAPVTLLPYVGPGWYPKVSLDYMLRCGVAQWSDVLHTMNAASHVTAECLAPALDVMEQAWPDGEEHMAKLAVNSMIGLMAHDSNKAYTLRSSSNELDATGADTRQVFYVGEGRYVWDFITTRSINPQQRDAAPHPRLRARLRGDDGGTHPTRTGPSAKVHQAGENGLRGAAGHAAEVPRQLGAARPQHVPRR